MKYVFSLVAALALPNTLWANQRYFEFDLGVSQDYRGGSELDESGTGRELSDFSLADIDALAAFSLDSGLLVQGSIQWDRNFADSTLDGFVPTNDTYREGRQAALQFGQHFENHYVGAYAAVGRVAFNPFDFDQDADFRSLGVQGSWYGDNWQVSGSFAHLDSTADDPETIANAIVLGVTASFDASEDTRLTGSLTFTDGEQDLDSGSSPDPVQVLAIRLEVEHAIRRTQYGSLAAYGGVSRINVWEESSSSSTDHVNDAILTAGIRIRFGADSVQETDRRKSPPLPEMLRLLGAVPAVD